MSLITPLSTADLAYLEPYLPPAETRDATASEYPFVTLTYACSLDSMIALAPGARTTLSGPETKAMTHCLRLRHDAILVGVGTAVVDDPGLNCRYPGVTLERQPRPVIIDPHRRFRLDGRKVCQLAAGGEGKAPWIFSLQRDAQERQPLSSGAEYITLQEDSASKSGSMPWPSILRTLKAKGINSVMIEGGAAIINALLTMPEVVDSCIVTIAPTWLGRDGVNVAPPPREGNGQRINAAWLDQTAWRQFGNDVVLCGRPRRRLS